MPYYGPDGLDAKDGYYKILDGKIAVRKLARYLVGGALLIGTGGIAAGAVGLGLPLIPAVAAGIFGSALLTGGGVGVAVLAKPIYEKFAGGPRATSEMVVVGAATAIVALATGSVQTTVDAIERGQQHAQTLNKGDLKGAASGPFAKSIKVDEKKNTVTFTNSKPNKPN